MKSMQLSDLEADYFREIINMGVGRAAGSLNELLMADIQLEVPVVKTVPKEEAHLLLVNIAPDYLAATFMRYSGAVNGTTSLIFSPDSANRLVDLILPEEEISGDEIGLDMIRESTLMEVGNIVLNGVLGSIANVLGLGLSFDVPWYANTEIASFFDQMMISSEEYIIYAKASMLVKDHQIEGVILLLFDVSTIGKLGEIINSILNSRL